MLVLNTNRENERDFSNQMLVGGYLDFNQILLKPYIYNSNNNSNHLIFSAEGNNAPNAWSYAEKEVNGTKVNIARSCLLEKRRLLDNPRGNSGTIKIIAQNAVNIGQTQTISNTHSIRMGLEGNFIGGELVGKRMMGLVHFSPTAFISHTSAKYENLVIRFRYILNLLGSNGVIRKIGDSKWIEFRSNQGYGGNMDTKYIKDFFDNSFDPVQANEGDMIVVDVEMHSSMKIINNSSYNVTTQHGVQIYFGSNSALEENSMIRPIQISVE